MNDTIIWVLAGSLGLLLISIGQLRNDIDRMNITLTKISKHIGLADTAIENIDGELKDLISKGKKIKAIKRYRDVTGIGLKESKEYIDKLSEYLLK